MIILPEDLDSLSHLSSNLPAPAYTDEYTQQANEFTETWNAFDFLSTCIIMGCQCLTAGKDMYPLHTREGLVELFNRLFRYPTIKSVVQVLSKSGDTLI